MSILGRVCTGAAAVVSLFGVGLGVAFAVDGTTPPPRNAGSVYCAYRKTHGGGPDCTLSMLCTNCANPPRQCETGKTIDFGPCNGAVLVSDTGGSCTFCEPIGIVVP
jgi:hypothetical protein